LDGRYNKIRTFLVTGARNKLVEAMDANSGNLKSGFVAAMRRKSASNMSCCCCCFELLDSAEWPKLGGGAAL